MVAAELMSSPSSLEYAEMRARECTPSGIPAPLASVRGFAGFA